MQEAFCTLSKQENSIAEEVSEVLQCQKLLETSDPALAALAYVAAKHRISESAIKDIARRVLPLHLEKPSPTLVRIAQQGAEFSVDQLWRTSVLGCDAPRFEPRLINLKSRSGQDVSLPIWSLQRWLEQLFATTSMVKHLVVSPSFLVKSTVTIRLGLFSTNIALLRNVGVHFLLESRSESMILTLHMEHPWLQSFYQ